MSTNSAGSQHRRTVARRSCDLCRRQKTRCELPNSSVPDSDAILPPSQSCHRCVALARDCIVNSSRRPPNPSDLTGGIGYASSASVRKRNRISQSMQGWRDSGDTAIDVLPTFMTNLQSSPHKHPALQTSMDSDASDSRILQNPPKHTIHLSTREASSLHSHALAHNLLRQVIGANVSSPRHSIHSILRNERYREEIRDAYRNLLIQHPYLPSLQSLTSWLGPGDNFIPDTLLASLVFYLCLMSSLDLGAAQIIETIQELSQAISQLWRTVISDLDTSTNSMSAFILILHHAPLGVLPLTPITSPHEMSLQQGTMLILHQIAAPLTRHIQAWPRMTLEASNAEPEFWTWMAYCELVGQWEVDTFTCGDQKAHQTLEQSISLSDQVGMGSDMAHAILDNAMASGSTTLPMSDDEESYQYVGRLWLCEKLQRLSIVKACLERLTRTLQESDEAVMEKDRLSKAWAIVEDNMDSLQSAEDRFFSLTESLTIDLKQLSPPTFALFRIVRLQHVARLLGFAMKSFLVHVQRMLPQVDLTASGSACARDERPDIVHPSRVIRWIVEDHGDLHRFAKGIAKKLGDARTDNVEMLLVAFASFRSSSSLSVRKDCLVPLHLCLSTVLESCHVLMETQACSLLVTQSSRRTAKVHRVEHWDHLMNEIAAMMLSVGRDYPLSSTQRSLAPATGQLILSMVRVIEETRKTIGRGISLGPQRAPSSKNDGYATMLDGETDVTVDFAYDELLATILGVEYFQPPDSEQWVS